MRRSDWLERAKDVAQKHGGECLSDLCSTALDRICMKCAKGHIWDVRAANIIAGKWCPKCAKMLDIAVAEIDSFVFQRYGGKCLAQEYSGSKAKILFKCDKGHLFESTYNSVQQGHWCKRCRHKVASKQTIIDRIHVLGGKLIGSLTDDTNGRTKFNVICNACGNEWETCYNMCRVSWCAKCGGRPKITMEEFVHLVEEKNGIVLGSEYVNCDTPILIRCNQCLNEWSISWSNLKAGYWCPKCVGRNRHTEESIRQCLWQSGIELLGKFRRVADKTEVRCKICGKEWSPTLSNLLSGHGCSRCSSKKIQRMLFEMCKEIFWRYKIEDEYKFEWLRTDKNRYQRVDIYVRDIGLIIEYDGEQHFGPIRFGGISKEKAEIKFNRQRELDAIKDEKIRCHSEDVKYLIRFSYKEKLTKEYVINKLREHGILIEAQKCIHRIG